MAGCDMGIDFGSVTWDDDEIKSCYKDFLSIYTQRPIAENKGGMRAPHAYATWFLLRHLRPEVVIESGVWKGQGTWLIESACPDAKIICLDLNFGNLAYKSAKAEYINRDFSNVDFQWVEKRKAVCFFDDHQDAFNRLRQLKWKGFKVGIFEDNYPVGRGDVYSLKKVNEQVSIHVNDQYSEVENQSIAIAHRNEMLSNLSLYYEFPPLFKTKQTRWGMSGQKTDTQQSRQFLNRQFLMNSKLRQDTTHGCV